MLEYLAELELPTVVVLTKIDKVGRQQAETRASEIMGSLSLSREQTIPFSAATGEGRDELAAAVASLVDVTRNREP
jgi:GTP-binding protein